MVDLQAVYVNHGSRRLLVSRSDPGKIGCDSRCAALYLVAPFACGTASVRANRISDGDIVRQHLY